MQPVCTQVRYLGKTVLLVREPEDVAAVLLRRADSFVKHPRQKRVALWLGGGLRRRGWRHAVIPYRCVGGPPCVRHMYTVSGCIGGCGVHHLQ